jgi:hypothetical protein
VMSAVKCWGAFVCDIFHLSQGERGPLGPPGLPGFSGNPVSTRLFKSDFLWLSSHSSFGDSYFTTANIFGEAKLTAKFFF